MKNLNSDFRRKLVMFLDGALDKEESRNFLSEIKGSPEHMEFLQQWWWAIALVAVAGWWYCKNNC